MTSASLRPRYAPPRPSGFADLRRRLRAIDTSPITSLGRGVWIHGAGGMGRSVARALQVAGVPILGVLDRTSLVETSIDGLRVLHPDAIEDGDVEGAFHVHAVMNHYAPSSAISDWAVTRDFAGLLFPSDLYRIPGFRLANYWLAPPAETLAKIDVIEACHDALDDEGSRALLRALLVYRLTSDPRLHPDAQCSEAYTPDFLPIFDRPITFVDGGAYTGDSLEALLRRDVTIDGWIAFEPDAENMSALRLTAARHRDRIGSHRLVQSGLADHAGRVAFSNGCGEASRVLGALDGAAATGGTHVDVVRADDVVDARSGVYIKLDIEGAEMSALRGMPGLLASNPVLAVSVYHRPRDLWEIPLHLMRDRANAFFRLRQHGHHGFDTVLYVVPK